MRTSGLFLHVTSLPSAYGIGDLGPAAYRFADFLKRAEQTLWQVLPLGPVGAGASPYSSPSSFAGNPLLISPERLVERGLLEESELAPAHDFPKERVDFSQVIPFKEELLRKAFRRFEEEPARFGEAALKRFRSENDGWLGDYALYMALKDAHGGGSWTGWPRALARREAKALDAAREEHARALEQHAFWQWLFYEQWEALKRYCHARGLELFGDLPIYAAHDSADVWANQDLFFLDNDGQPTVVSGVPPDYFSETGQRWGNPIYRWDRMQKNGYAWWTERLRAVLGRVDLVRLDHFRGFEAYWEIPADEETAVNGRWVDGPGAPFFEKLRQEIGALPVVAEDLGIITDDVRALMKTLRLPGMAVLPFGLGDGPSSTNVPHHYHRRLAAYTSTHDTDTFCGWYATADEEHQQFARRTLGIENGQVGKKLHWAAVRAVMASVAERAVFSVQDLLGLGSEARMNTPGEGGGNWAWRLEEGQLTDKIAERLAALTETYDRAPRTQKKSQKKVTN